MHAPSRTSVGFASICFAVALWSPGAALASDSAAALQDYFDGLRALGATRVDHGAIEDDPATGVAIVSDIAIEWPITMSFGQAGGFTINVGFTAPSATVKGAVKTTDGYEIERAATGDGSTFTMSVEGLEDFTLTGKVDGWQADGMYWPSLPVIQDDPARPFSRYYPYLRWTAAFEAERAAITRLEIDQVGPDNNRQHTVYNDLIVTNQKGGVIESVQSGRTVVKAYQAIPAPQKAPAPQMGNDETADGAEKPEATPPATPVLEMTYEIASVGYRNYDIGRLVRLFDPESYAIGQVDDTLYPVLDEAWANDITVSFEGGSARINRYGGTGFKMRQPKMNIISLVDRVMLGDEPSEQEAAQYALAMLGSFAFDRLSIDDVVIAPPKDEGSGRIERIAMRDVSSDKIGEFVLEGVDVKGPQNEAFSLDRFSFRDLVFPTAAAIMAIAEYSDSGREPPPSMVLAVIPLISEIETRNLKVAAPEIGSISLKSAMMTFANHIGSIPTVINSTIEEFSAPVTALEDREAQVLFDRMGIKTVVFDEEIRLRWDEATQVLTVGPISMNVRGAGMFKMTAEFGGVPRLVFENPEAAQAALATLNFRSAKFEIDNERMVQAAIELAAEDGEMSEEEARQVILLEMRKGVQQVQSPALAEMVDQAVSAFLADPDRLTVEAKPAQPLPITQIMGLAAVAPQAIVQQLGLSVRANQ
ncbi:MAG: hypothetical protein C0606_01755 [Hyphomicrobiales bacterium]|nr:MAG: hypothetical protein C0606_01755 [Hyphomicrobiales bacterium]